MARDKKRRGERATSCCCARPGTSRSSAEVRRGRRWSRRSRSCARDEHAATAIEVLHGVNLDMLGKRDPSHYGTLTLIELEVRIRHWARELGLETSFFQTNSEGEYVERLHQAPQARRRR